MKKIIMTMVGCIWMMAAYAQGPMVRLSNGVEMPQFGIGTFAVPSNEVARKLYLRLCVQDIDISTRLMPIWTNVALAMP